MKYIIFFLIGSLSACAELKFTGIVASSDHQKFALLDTGTGSSGWIELGRSFQGYKLSAFDPQQQVLTLTHGDESLSLALEVSKITEVSKQRTEPTVSELAAAKALAEAGDSEIKSALSFYQETLYLIKMQRERLAFAKKSEDSRPVGSGENISAIIDKNIGELKRYARKSGLEILELLKKRNRAQARLNQALEPTALSVMNPAEPGFTPTLVVAHLLR